MTENITPFRPGIAPGRGHFETYLWRTHRLGVNQVTFYSARQAWDGGTRYMWDFNPNMWSDLKHAVSAYASGPRFLTDNYDAAYKARNPYVGQVNPTG